MIFLQITHGPVYRPGNPLTAPLGAVVSRLLPSEHAELRMERSGGSLCCYIGLPDPERAEQVLTALFYGGYIVRKQPLAPSAVRTNCLLHRAVDRQLLVGNGGTPEQLLLPVPIQGSLEGVMMALSHVREGTGLSFFFRPVQQLSLATASHLNRSGAELPMQLLHSPRLYEAVGCTFGPQAAFLAAELCCSYPALRQCSIAATAVSSQLLECPVSANLSIPLQPLLKTWLPEEVNAFGDLCAAAGTYGLPLNKDTIFSPPAPIRIPTEPGESLFLGTSHAGHASIKLPIRTLRRHMMLAGAQGSGKGNAQFSIITQLYDAGIPILIIEGAKTEMHYLHKVCPELATWEPKEGSFVMNPFFLHDDLTLGQMRPAFLQILRQSFKVDGPLEELFSEALNRCFAKNGYSDNSTNQSPNVRPFGLSEFMEEFVRLSNEQGYSSRAKSDVTTAGKVRLKSLFNENRALFDTVASIPVSTLLSGTNLIQLNCLPTVESKQLFASMLLIFISSYLRLRGKHAANDRPLKLAILIDESHNLLAPASSSEGHQFSFSRDFANILLELRSQGVGVILADQSTDNLPPQISDICATKIFLGASAASGIHNHRVHLGADDTALQNLYLLGPGEGCLVTAGMPHAVYFSAPNLIDKFGLHIPYPRCNSWLDAHPRLVIETYRECENCPARGKCTLNSKASARQKAAVLVQRYYPQLSRLLRTAPGPERDKQLSSGINILLLDAKQESKDSCEAYCTLIQTVRDINREAPGSMPLDKLLAAAARSW